jgi:hypothetical protein
MATELVALVSMLEFSETTSRLFTLSGVSVTMTLHSPDVAATVDAGSAPPVTLMVVVASAVPVRLIGLVEVDCAGVVMTGAEGAAANTGRAPQETARRSAVAVSAAAALFAFWLVMFIRIGLKLVMMGRREASLAVDECL